MKIYYIESSYDYNNYRIKIEDEVFMAIGFNNSKLHLELNREMDKSETKIESIPSLDVYGLSGTISKEYYKTFKEKISDFIVT